MNIETPKSPAPETQKKTIPKYILVFLFGLAALAFFRMAVLVIEPVPGISKSLVSTYISYAIGTCFILHFCAFYSYIDDHTVQSALHEIVRHGEGRSFGGDSGSRSTTASRIILLEDFKSLSAGSIDQNSSNVLTWFALIVLPIGIGLRLLKTSLELF